MKKVHGFSFSNIVECTSHVICTPSLNVTPTQGPRELQKSGGDQKANFAPLFRKVN